MVGASAHTKVPTPKMARVNRYDARGPNLTQQRVDRGRGDDGADQVHRDHPCVEPLATDIGDRAGQQADGEELVGRVEADAAGQQGCGADPLSGRAGLASCPV